MTLIKKVTIDELASMMKGSFDHLEGKIDKLEEKVDRRFEDMDKRFDDLEIMVGRHENRITNLEDSMRVVKTALGK